MNHVRPVITEEALSDASRRFRESVQALSIIDSEEYVKAAALVERVRGRGA